jgi:hypothetical protein
MLRRDLGEVPRPDRLLDRLEQGVLADSLGAAENKGMVDFLMRPLDPVGKPSDDMAGVIAEKAVGMVKPWVGASGSSGDGWGPVKVKHGASRPLDPSAVGNEPVGY